MLAFLDVFRVLMIVVLVVVAAGVADAPAQKGRRRWRNGTLIAKRLLAGLAPVALVAGCTVGPNYHAPADRLCRRHSPGRSATPPGATVDPATLVDGVRRSAARRSRRARARRTIPTSRSPPRACGRRGCRRSRRARGGKPTVNATAGGNHIEFSKNAGFSSLARIARRRIGRRQRRWLGRGHRAAGRAASRPMPPASTPAGRSICSAAPGAASRRRAARAEAAVWNQRDAAVTLAAEVAARLFRASARPGSKCRSSNRKSRGNSARCRSRRISPRPGWCRNDRRYAPARQRHHACKPRLEPVRADIRVRVHALGILLGEPPEALDR